MNNISFYRQTPYSQYYSNDVSGRLGAGNNTFFGRKDSSLAAMWGQEHPGEKTTMSKQMRYLIRGLQKTPGSDQNPYVATSKDRVNGFLELSGSPDKEDDNKNTKRLDYNYKEVATKIQRAKTSLSAGEAVISAKRNVLDIKRKISNKDGDPEELQLALTHAKRMEMAAKKKKNHLEIEEMVVNTQKRDDNMDKAEEAVKDMKNALISKKEEELTKEADAIFKEREEMIRQARKELEEKVEQVTDDMLSDLNEMISEFGEEELEELQEAMEMLDCMEIVDPHMSREDLEELKRKHRAEENKAIMKADMDYLKGMIRHQTEMGMSASGTMSDAMSSGIITAGLAAGAELSLLSPAAESGASINVQV